MMHETMSEPAPLPPPVAAALLRASAAAIRAELAAHPPALLAWHPAPGEWCAKEVIGHLAEAETRGFAGRIRRLVTAPADAPPPRFETWDQAAVARARHDCARELPALLAEWGRLREAGLALVEGLRESDLGRAGHHPTVGVLSVGDLLHEWVHHDRNHFRQILAGVQAYVWGHMGNARRFSQPD